MEKRLLLALLAFLIFISGCVSQEKISRGLAEGTEKAEEAEIENYKNSEELPIKTPHSADEIPEETLKEICRQEEWPTDCGMIPVVEGVEMCKRCKSVFPSDEPEHTERYGQDTLSKSKFPPCGDKKELFTVPHIPISELQNIVPLGNLNPPGHTFPTNHLYFHLKGFTGVESLSSAPVVAPGDILVTRIGSSEYTMKGRNIKDYKLDFTVCHDVRGYFIHLTSLSDRLLQNFGQPSDCKEYDTGGTHYKNCEKDFYFSPVSLVAGEPIGIVGGSSDFGLADLRIEELAYANPKRWYEDPLHRACPLEYFTADISAQLRSLLGSYDTKRTIEPICGEVAQDIYGTAQGVWFVKGTKETYPEDPHISLVHDNTNPLKGVFSVGNSMNKSGLPAGLYYFTPKNSGFVNRDFKYVEADDNIYCYETEGMFSGKSSFIILIKLTTPTKLLVEKENSYSCGNGPWSFSSDYTEFER
jgi:hypothetical protein